MKDFQIAITAVTAIILFLFGLENFSKEIQKITGEKFRSFLANSTKNPIMGVFIGAILTAFIQSSAATSLITISLVNAGVLSFKSSIGIIFGSNVGSTVAAQLVAFKLTAFAPIFIILGFALNLAKTKYSVFAKSLFYFGFVFFSLNLISSTLTPLQSDVRVVSFLTTPQGMPLGILIGFLITVLVQSSSVTTGLAVIFTQQGLLGLENAIPILMGANIGTTLTAFLTSINMDISAKKTALAHFLFNIGGVAAFIPIVYFYSGDFSFLGPSPAIILANFHLSFNLATTLVFLIFLTPFTLLIDKIMGEGKMDFERIDLSFIDSDEGPEVIQQELNSALSKTLAFAQENYNLVTLSIETNFKSILEASNRRMEYLEFVMHEFQKFFSLYIATHNDTHEIKNIVRRIKVYEYISQIHDSVKDLAEIKKTMDDNFIEIQSDLVLIVRDLSTKTTNLFSLVIKSSQGEIEGREVEKLSKDLQKAIDNYNRELLRLMSMPNRVDAGSLLHIITYSQRLKDKLLTYLKNSLEDEVIIKNI